MSEPLTLAQRCRRIELLVLDVDGVLTAGDIVHGDGGLELKSFDVRDGTGFTAWRESGKQAAIVTGRTSQAVLTRAAELGVGTVVQGVGDKRAAFRRLLKETRLPAGQAAFVGDDLPDLAVLAEAGLAVAVANACAEVRLAAHYVTRAAGGRGAVREVIELILYAQGKWAEVVERFRRETAETDG